MSLTKLTPEILEGRRNEIVKLNGEIRELEAVLKEKDSPLWQRIGPALKNSIEVNRNTIEEIASAGPKDKNGTFVDPMAEWAAIKVLGGAIAAYRHVLSAVEVEQIIEKKRARVQDLTEDLKKAQEAI